MKRTKLLAAVCAAAMLTASLPVCAEEALKAEDFVHASGAYVIGTDGQPLQIKGMALGNNVYVSPYNVDYNHHTEDTYKELSELGFNCVRFYLNYEMLESDDNPYSYKEEGFEWLDKNIEWAKKYDMGMIFNMHYPQGGYQSQGNGTALWSDKENQKRLAALWKAIAERYANEPAVWGYGLINEPYVPYLGNKEATIEQCRELMNYIADEIRSVSPHQAIVVETGLMCKDYSTGDFLSLAEDDGEPLYFLLDDNNVIYEFHFYQPMAFTHQNAEWANTAGSTMSYPSDDIASADYESWWVDFTAAEKKNEDGSWSYFETPEMAATERYNIAYTVVAANKTGAKNYVYFDELMLIETAPDGSERVMYYEDFSNGNISDFYTWSSDGTGIAEYCADIGHNKNGCIKLGGNSDMLNASSGKHIEMRDGYTYKVTGYRLGDSGDIRIDYAKADNIRHFDSNFVCSALQVYADFAQTHHVPLYLGEFGVIRSGFEEGRNGESWAADVMDFCLRNGIGFNYHAYHEGPFGLYKSDSYVLPAEADINAPLRDTFKEKLSQYSELHGDCNNDGILSPADASALLKDIVGAKAAANPARRDFNLDGTITPKDASALLKKLVE